MRCACAVIAAAVPARLPRLSQSERPSGPPASEAGETAVRLYFGAKSPTAGHGTRTLYGLHQPIGLYRLVNRNPANPRRISDWRLRLGWLALRPGCLPVTQGMGDRPMFGSPLTSNITHAGATPACVTSAAPTRGVELLLKELR